MVRQLTILCYCLWNIVVLFTKRIGR